MRLMLKFRIPIERPNNSIPNDLAILTVKRLIDQLNPEASYFYFEKGKRTGIIVFKAKSQKEIIPLHKMITEKFDVELEVQPALDFDDLLESL